MVVLAFLLWSHVDWRSWVVALLFVLAAIGRIYVGVHFPLDVAVGLLLGIAAMGLCWRWSQTWKMEAWQDSQWAWKIPGFIVALEAAVLGLGYHVQPSTAQVLALVIPVAALFILMHVWKGKLGHKK